METAIDTMQASEIELGDCIRFEYEGETVSGEVIAIDDETDTIQITLSSEAGYGDAEAYSLPAGEHIEVLAYGV